MGMVDGEKLGIETIGSLTVKKSIVIVLLVSKNSRWKFGQVGRCKDNLYFCVWNYPKWTLYRNNLNTW